MKILKWKPWRDIQSTNSNFPPKSKRRMFFELTSSPLDYLPSLSWTASPTARAFLLWGFRTTSPTAWTLPFTSPLSWTSSTSFHFRLNLVIQIFFILLLAAFICFLFRIWWILLLLSFISICRTLPGRSLGWWYSAILILFCASIAERMQAYINLELNWN